MKLYEILCEEISEVSYTVRAYSKKEARKRVEEGEGSPIVIDSFHKKILATNKVE